MNEEKIPQEKELEQVQGGTDGKDSKGWAYCYCSNPKCPNHREMYNIYPETCMICGAEMIWKDY